MNTKNNEEYKKRKNFLKSILTEYYGDLLPPTSFIGQPPEDQQEYAIELILLNEKQNDINLERKSINGIFYSVINYKNTKEVYAGGLTAEFDSYSTLLSSRNAFDLMEQILTAENLTFGDVVRQWNYIEGIIDQQFNKEGIQQNYQIFNDVRSIYYSKANFDNGYPAATGIGMNAGGIILEFIAAKNTQKVDIVPIKNPGQVDAFRYSGEVLVGKPIDEISKKTSPKFERAKYTKINNIGQIYISGTAAIRGQKSVSDQNVKEQTIITIENINELISKANLSNYGIELNSHPLKPSYLRVYVREEKDVADVKEICNKSYPNVPAIYLLSDICRDDLLVELEGIANF
ncbi:PTS cellobiose transporter subunit IIC [candidate division KSB1 bacterium]|nr:PTS cellobiose transporter subunit IIC [candidate division KSB1 bacterium]